MRPLVVTRAGVVGSLVVLVVAATCVRLGIWQLHRLAERRERNAVQAGRMHQPPLVLTRASMDTAGLTYRAARATGTWDDERTIVWAGRSYDGDPGVYLLTPLRFAAASGENSAAGAILVNRGWVPSADAASVDLARYPATSPAPVTVGGMLLPLPSASAPPPSAFKRTWFHLDGRAVARQLPYPLEPMLLQLEQAAGPATVPRPIPPPALDEGPHLSYAIQWFSFATIGIVGWIAMLLRRGDAAPRAPVSRESDVA